VFGGPRRGRACRAAIVPGYAESAQRERIDPWPERIVEPPARPFIDCDLASATGGSQDASSESSARRACDLRHTVAGSQGRLLGLGPMVEA
jgi:hypothetical protein